MLKIYSLKCFFKMGEILWKTWLWYLSAQRQIVLTRYVAEKAYMGGMREWTYFCPLVVVSITKDLCAFVSRAISLNRQKNLHEGILAVFCILCILTLCFKKFVDGILGNLYIHVCFYILYCIFWQRLSRWNPRIK